MKKSITVLCAFSLFLFGCADDTLSPQVSNQNQTTAGQSTQPPTQKDLSPEEQSAQFLPLTNDDWVSYYYSHKNEEGLKTFFKDLMQSKDFNSQDEKILVTKYAYTGFLTGLFTQNPTKVDEWLKGKKFKGETGTMLAGALLMSGMGDKIPQYTDLPNNTPPNQPKKTLIEMPLQHPFMPILLTYAFSGSGNLNYISRMIDGIEGKISLGTKTEQQEYMRNYLTYRLMQARFEHVSVEKLIAERQNQGFNFDEAINKLKSSNPKQAEAITKQLEIYNNGLSADLLLLSNQQMSGKSKEKDLKSISAVKRGEEFGVALTFQGMKVNEVGEASVTYDFKVFDPQGQEKTEMSDTDVVAMKAKTPTRFIPFTPRVIPILRFLKEMPEGDYTISVTIKDTIGGQTKTFSAPIKLQGGAVS